MFARWSRVGKKDFLRRLSAVVTADDKDEEPHGQEAQTLPFEQATHQESALIDGDENADEKTPLLNQLRNLPDVEEAGPEKEGEEGTSPSDSSKLKGVNALRSILLPDPDGEHPEDEDSISPESHAYLFLGDRDAPDLTQAKATLEQVENRSSFLKWGYWDNIFNKMTYAIWLRQNDVTVSPRGCCPRRPLWVDGDGLPLSQAFQQPEDSQVFMKEQLLSLLPRL